MSYATLLLHVDAEDGRQHLVRLAAQLADKFSAKLVGCSALPIRPPVVVNGVVVDAVTQAEIGLMRAKLSEKEKWFRDIAGTEQRKIEWRSGLDFPTEALVAEARCADLLVVSPSRGLRSAYNSLDPGGAILQAGRPVLVVPDNVNALQAERIVIGWKDTREARRAVADALPFLHEATRVTIAEICEPGDEEAARARIDDVVHYLVRHRIKGNSQVILKRERSPSDQLVRLAQDEGADLIVTGAYGHTRLGEWIFGGVTHDLLASSPVCCLMSH